MSQRLMNILSAFSPQVEIYSIDEAFVDVSGMEYFSLNQYGHQMKDAIFDYTGLPVGVGIAPTKVLAKLANRISKKRDSENQGVFVIDSEEKYSALPTREIMIVFNTLAISVVTVHIF